MTAVGELLEDRVVRWSLGLGGVALVTGFAGMALSMPLLSQIGFGLLAAGIAVFLVILLGTRALRILRTRRQARFDAELVSREGVAERRAEWKNWSAELEREGVDRYSLPFFLLVGEPQSGKSVLLQNSGLNFPFGQAKLSGVAGTRGCDWWFTQEAVILDIAGRMFTHDSTPSDAAEWQAFLELLRGYRPLAPADGILLVLPCDGLLSDGPDAMAAKADRIRASLLTLVETLEVSIPIYVVMTKADRVFGFAETVHRLEEKRRRQMFGWSRGESVYARPFSTDEVRTGFRDMVRRSRALRAHAMSTVPMPEAVGEVDRLYAFPDELAGLEEPLLATLDRIFGAPPLDKRLFFRGLYLTSGLQSGVPIARLCHDAFRSVGEGDLRKLEAIFEKQRAYFIKDLIRNRVFSERGLVEPSEARVKRARHARAAGLVGSAAAVLASIWVAFGYFLEDPNNEANDTRELSLLAEDISDGGLDARLTQARVLRSIAEEYDPSTLAELAPGAAVDRISIDVFDRHFDELLVPEIRDQVLAAVGLGIDVLETPQGYSFGELEQVTDTALGLEAELAITGDRVIRSTGDGLDSAAIATLLPTALDLAQVRTTLSPEQRDKFDELRRFRTRSGHSDHDDVVLAGDIGDEGAARLAALWASVAENSERRVGAPDHWELLSDLLLLDQRATSLRALARSEDAAGIEPLERYLDAHRAASDLDLTQLGDLEKVGEAWKALNADKLALTELLELRKRTGGDAETTIALEPDPATDRATELVVTDADGELLLHPRLLASDDGALADLCEDLTGQLPGSARAIATAIEGGLATIQSLDVERGGDLEPRRAGRNALRLALARWSSAYLAPASTVREGIDARVRSMLEPGAEINLDDELALIGVLDGLTPVTFAEGEIEGLDEWLASLSAATQSVREALVADLSDRVRRLGLSGIDFETDRALLNATAKDGQTSAIDEIIEQIGLEREWLDTQLTTSDSRHVSLRLGLRSVANACTLESFKGDLLNVRREAKRDIDDFMAATLRRVERLESELAGRQADLELGFLNDDDRAHVATIRGSIGLTLRREVTASAAIVRRLWMVEAAATWQLHRGWRAPLLIDAVRELEGFEEALGNLAGIQPQDRATELVNFDGWYANALADVVESPPTATALLEAYGRPPSVEVREASVANRPATFVLGALAEVEGSTALSFRDRARSLRSTHDELLARVAPADDGATLSAAGPSARLELDLSQIAAAAVRREIADAALERLDAASETTVGSRVLRYLGRSNASAPEGSELVTFFRRVDESRSAIGEIAPDRLAESLTVLGLVTHDDALAVVVPGPEGDLTVDLPPPVEARDEPTWQALFDLVRLVETLAPLDGTATIATVGKPAGADRKSSGWDREYFRIENGSVVPRVRWAGSELLFIDEKAPTWSVKVDPTDRLDGGGLDSVLGTLRIGWQENSRPFESREANEQDYVEASGLLAPLQLVWNYAEDTVIAQGTPLSAWTLLIPYGATKARLEISFDRPIPPRPSIPDGLLSR